MAVIGDTLLLAYSEADEMTITGSTTASSMPVSYLLKPQPSDVTRFTSVTPHIIVNRGLHRSESGIKMRAIWLNKVFVEASTSSGCTARIRTAYSEPGLTGAPDYDSGTVDFFASNVPPSFYAAWPDGKYHDFFFILPDGDGLVPEWVRIDLDLTGDGTVPGTYVDISRLYLIADDTFIQPITNPTYPLSGSRVESVQIEETPGGVRVPSPSYGRRKRGGSWGWLTADEAEQAESFIAARGLSRDVLVWPFPTETTGQNNRLYSCYGLLSSWSGPTMNSYPETALDFEVEELR